MGKKYKVSKFVFYCLDSNGNLLLINFLVGIKSLVCVEKEHIEEFKKNILDNKYIVADTTNKSVIEKLKNIGVLIDSDINEDMIYDAKFYAKTYSDSWQLVIMPTHRCNFKCKYCYENEDFTSVRDMNLEDQKSILKYIQKNAVLYPKLRVSWFGGEPLLAIKTIQFMSGQILQICAKRGVRYESEITTNGYNMTPQVFDMLYKNMIYIYQVTLDGAKAQHDKQRVKANGTGTFDRIFDNLLYIRNNPQKYKFARITIRTNVTKSIVQNLKSYLDLYYKYFASDSRFSLRFTEAYNYNLLMEKSENRLPASDYLRRDEFLDLVYDIKNREKVISIDDIVSMFTPIRSVCYAAAKNKYVIDANLDIYKCTVHFNNKENKIGFLSKNGDMIIDEAANIKWYVRSAVPKCCKGCFYLPCCNRTGCPLKYNKKESRVYKKCNIEDLKEKIAVNMRRLATYYLPMKIEMKE